MTYDEFCEIFFDIPGYEGYYQINLNEEVRGLDRKFLDKKGVLQSRYARNMTVYINKGYKVVALAKDGRKFVSRIYKLLATTFLANPNNYNLVRHLNDDRLDNRLTNLCWGSYKDNADDAWKNKRFKSRKGSLNGNAKIVLDTSTGIYYDSAIEAAKAKGLSKYTVWSGLNGAAKNNTSLIYA